MVALQERNFSTRADMYKGHKVVAMPASGSSDSAPLSIRDIVTSPRAFDPNRPRSLSAGRATTRSRDIVQEVYDRMGVNRGGTEPFDESLPHENSNNKGSDVRGRAATPGRGGREQRSPETADKFSQRYRAAAALSSPRGTTGGNERGRGAEQEAPRRSRSLSRGRAVAGRWPPAQNQTNEPSIPQPVPSFLPRKTEESAVAAANTPASVPASPNRGRTYSRTDSQEEVNTDGESKESQEKAEAPSVPSIKDRISAYAPVRSSSRNFPQKKPVNYQTYAKQKRPAQIDIYEDVRKQEDVINKQEDCPSESTTGPPEPSTVHPSPAAAAAADAAFAFVRGGSSSRSVKSAGAPSRTPKGNAGIAGTYLGAIKSTTNSTTGTPSSSNRPVVSQTTSAPLTEISAANATEDGNSVAASSVSADEFNFTSPTTARSIGGASAKKPSWAERNRPQVSPVGRAGTPNGNQYNTNGNRPSTPSASEIEKIVEQRVQSRVSVVEMRMEEQMQRLERRVEEKLKMRIDMLDSKIDQMNKMLAMLLSRELNDGSSREHRDKEI